MTAQPPIFDNIQFLKQQHPPSNLTIEQKQDFELIQDFLLQYTGSRDTFNVYRRETERLFQWAWFIHGQSLLTLSREDIETYIQFCQNPPKSWISHKNVARFKSIDGLRTVNPHWRLFVYSKKSTEHYELSQKAMQSLFSSLSSFYNHLIRENHTERNPITLIRQKSQYIRKQTKRHIRRLTSVQWQYVIDTARAMADANVRYERTLFIMSALYLMYLRISELVATERWQPEMGDFYQDANENWWFKTVGKGNKERDISVSDAMLNALKRYRDFLNLSPLLPAPGDITPLIKKERGIGGITSTRAIRLLVQKCFDHAIAAMKKAGLDDESLALKEATVHWLRHTGISDDLNKNDRPIAHVREDAGHSSSATTDLYNDAELKARHRSGKDKSI